MKMKMMTMNTLTRKELGIGNIGMKTVTILVQTQTGPTPSGTTALSQPFKAISPFDFGTFNN